MGVTQNIKDINLQSVLLAGTKINIISPKSPLFSCNSLIVLFNYIVNSHCLLKYNKYHSRFFLISQFNKKFLIFLMDCMNDCKYGTFLYNCERQRVSASLHVRTESVWDTVLNNRDRFVNPMYRPFPHHLKASESFRKIQLWDEYYLRHVSSDLPCLYCF